MNKVKCIVCNFGVKFQMLCERSCFGRSFLSSLDTVFETILNCNAEQRIFLTLMGSVAMNHKAFNWVLPNITFDKSLFSDPDDTLIETKQVNQEIIDKMGKV